MSMQQFLFSKENLPITIVVALITWSWICFLSFLV